MNLQKLIYSVPGLVSPCLRIHPSNKAHYEDPRKGEVVLSTKTKRSPAFNSTEMESKRTWTLTIHLSKRSTTKWEKLFNRNKAILDYKMNGYKLDIHRLEIKFRMNGKSGRTSQKQQKRHKAHLKKNPASALKVNFNFLLRNQESEECVDVASAMPDFPWDNFWWRHFSPLQTTSAPVFTLQDKV